MNHYITGNTIKSLREKKGYTQKQLANLLSLSDKTISKWETAKGLPDISLIEPLAGVLGVSVTELLSGEYVQNNNRSGNVTRSLFYVCPLCGNVIHALGEGVYSCCGITLPALEVEPLNCAHTIKIEEVENDFYLTSTHPMNKQHYLSFFAYVTYDTIQIKKLYPEQTPEARFPRSNRAKIYVYCNQHGLFQIK